MIRRQQLISAAQLILEMASHYKGAPHREMRLDGLVYGVLHVKFDVKRQHQIRSAVATRHPKRIDFRHGGTNPVVIELVVRTQLHKIEAYGGQNKDELYKLARQVQAKSRYLLILDVANEGIAKARLKQSYNDTPQQRGRGPRKPVRVIYVHVDDHYTFLWPP